MQRLVGELKKEMRIYKDREVDEQYVAFEHLLVQVYNDRVHSATPSPP
jgi:hypothetical protein